MAMLLMDMFSTRMSWEELLAPEMNWIIAIQPAVLFALIYYFIIIPYLFDRLSEIPNAHWSSPISRFWILSKRLHQQDTFAVHAAHTQLGPIVRLGPNEISVNSVEGGIRSVYAGGYEKGDWYKNVFSNYGVMPMFAMPTHGPHSKRKRMLSNVYAKSTLQGSASLAASSEILFRERLLANLGAMAEKGEPVEWYDVVGAVTMDFVCSYVFGLKNGSDFLQNPETCKKFLRKYKGKQKYEFWGHEVPTFTKMINGLGLGSVIIPQWVKDSNKQMQAWVLEMCDNAEKTLNAIEEDGEEDGEAQDYPTVYAQLRTALVKEQAKSDLDLPVSEVVRRNRLELASEMLDHSMAGFDTSAITLIFLTWELSLPEHKMWQEKLRDDLSSLAQEEKHSPKAIDNLPILHAILMETLRLHAAIPGNQPRITPSTGKVTLGAPGHEFDRLPANVRVNAQAWSLHRNPDVFSSPEEWQPARWLLSSDYPDMEGTSSSEQLKEMGRWFWAFGSGGRMCVGSNLAVQEMKGFMATVWGGFATKVVDDKGMVPNGGYTAEPVGKDGKYLVVKVEKL